MKDYGMVRHLIPLVAPVDLGNNSFASPYVDLKDALSCEFLLSTGALTYAASTATLTVTVEASSASASNASEVQLPFNYRVSAAVGTDTLGAVTAVAAATGIVVNDTQGSMLFIIEVDPAAIRGLNDLAHWVRLVGTKSGTITAALYDVKMNLIPRHGGTTMIASLS